jgi:hypothetical protein
LSRTRLEGEKTKIGGLALNTLKKLKGDKLGIPFSLIVLAKAIGLGPTALCKYPCSCAVGISFGLMLIIIFLFTRTSFRSYKSIEIVQFKEIVLKIKTKIF